MKISKKITLASSSPRRQQILSVAGLKFEVRVIPIQESFPKEMMAEEVPVHLSKKKAEKFENLAEDELIITADTVVILDGKILNKPRNSKEAQQMLSSLSGKTHKVVSAVTLKDQNQLLSFSDEALVKFNRLSPEEIDYYVEKYKPMDKAGAYGIQEFIGMIGIEKIEGSFYTIMGIPIHKLYQYLKPFIRY